MIAGPSWARVRNDISIALQLFQVTSTNPTWREAGVEPVALRGPDGTGDPRDVDVPDDLAAVVAGEE